MAEVLDLYDVNRIKLDHTMNRYEKNKDGEYRLVVHLVIFNSLGEILIQKRTDTKTYWPGLWDITVGGQVDSGETSQQGIQRESFEELGYIHDFSNERPVFTFNFKEGFDDIYVIEEDVDLTTLKLQETEVSMVKWASLEEIEDMINKNEFIKYYPEYLRLLKVTLHSPDIYNEGDK